MLGHIIEQSLLFLPMALGVYLSFAVLKRPDLTVDGSFLLGGGVYAKLLQLGMPPYLSALLAVIAGCAAGAGTAMLQRRERISPLLAGILAVFVIHSIALLLMGRPTISLLSLPNPLKEHSLLYILVVATIALSSMMLLLRSRLGLMLRAFGNNARLLEQCGHASESYRLLGLSVSNGLVALSGVMTAMSHGFADIGMGAGVVLIAIATVVLGQQVCKSWNITNRPASIGQLVGCLAGVMLYHFVIHLLITIGVSPLYLKMVIGLALISCLAIAPSHQLRETLS